MAILMMLILPIHEHGTCFHLFVSSLISLFSVVQFSEYKSFTPLVRFIPRYFIFHVAIANGIIFLISVSDVSLLVYKNAFDFSILICCFAKFICQLFCQIHLLSPVDFQWSLQDFLRTLSCHLQTMPVLLPPFQFGCLLFLFLV